MTVEIDIVKQQIEAMSAIDAFMFWSKLPKEQKLKYKQIVADKVGTLSGFCLK